MILPPTNTVIATTATTASRPKRRLRPSLGGESGTAETYRGGSGRRSVEVGGDLQGRLSFMDRARELLGPFAVGRGLPVERAEPIERQLARDRDAAGARALRGCHVVRQLPELVLARDDGQLVDRDLRIESHRRPPNVVLDRAERPCDASPRPGTGDLTSPGAEHRVRRGVNPGRQLLVEVGTGETRPKPGRERPPVAPTAGWL